LAGENGKVRKNTFQLSGTDNYAHAESQRFAAGTEDVEEKRGSAQSRAPSINKRLAPSRRR